MTAPNQKTPAPRNRTIELNGQEIEIYRKRLLYADNDLSDCRNKIICADTFETLKRLPVSFQANLTFAPDGWRLSSHSRWRFS